MSVMIRSESFVRFDITSYDAKTNVQTFKCPIQNGEILRGNTSERKLGTCCTTISNKIFLIFVIKLLCSLFNLLKYFLFCYE